MASSPIPSPDSFLQITVGFQPTPFTATNGERVALEMGRRGLKTLLSHEADWMTLNQSFSVSRTYSTVLL